MINPMDLTGRTILVTGASSGLGRGIALQAGRLGARVIVVARRRERLEETAAMMEGTDCVIEPYDLSEIDGINAWVKGLCGRIGPLHGFVHAAGVHVTRPIRQLKWQHAEPMIRLNYFAGSALTTAFRQRGCWEAPASIVYISSIISVRGKKGVSAYAASKGAVDAMTRCVALELAPEKIRANSICPATVWTEMFEGAEDYLTDDAVQRIVDEHPLGVGEPVDVANAACFLLSDAGRWITGTSMIVDGGFQLGTY